jgi:hypothetical protein
LTTDSSAAFGFGSDRSDWSVSGPEDALPAAEDSGAGLPPMQPLSRNELPSAAPPKSRLRRDTVVAEKAAGVMIVVLL